MEIGLENGTPLAIDSLQGDDLFLVVGNNNSDNGAFPVVKYGSSFPSPRPLGEDKFIVFWMDFCYNTDLVEKFITSSEESNNLSMHLALELPVSDIAIWPVGLFVGDERQRCHHVGVIRVSNGSLNLNEVLLLLIKFDLDMEKKKAIF